MKNKITWGTKLNNKNAKKNQKNKMLFFFVVLPILTTGLFFYALYQVVTYIEKRDLEIYNNAWEAGYWQGGIEATTPSETLKITPVLNSNYRADKDTIYSNFSKNPQVVALFKQYFPDVEQARIMRAISLAESKGKQTAVNKANRNGSIDSGFFQINTIHRKKGETKEQFIVRLHDLETNFKEAKRILDADGYTAWSTFNNKAYLAFMR